MVLKEKMITSSSPTSCQDTISQQYNTISQHYNTISQHYKAMMLKQKMITSSSPTSCGTEAGSYLRLIDCCTTQLKAQGPSKFRTCNESKEEEEKDFLPGQHFLALKHLSATTF